MVCLIHPTLVWNPIGRVECLYWWKCTLTRDFEFYRPPSVVQAPALKVLHIISVLKTFGRLRPLFQALQLRELVLISLHDGDIPWCLRDVLYGDSHVEKVYLERTTDPSRDRAPPMAIRSEELRKVIPTVKILHVRGYTPKFVMTGMPQLQVTFQNLLELVLDISEIPKRSSTKIESEGDDVTLTMEQQRFPLLQHLTLMCIKEAHIAEALSNVNLGVLVGASCTQVSVSDFVKPLSMTLDGERLVVDKSRYLGNPRIETPVVESRRCKLWTSDVRSGSIRHSGEQLIGEWVGSIREY